MAGNGRQSRREILVIQIPPGDPGTGAANKFPFLKLFSTIPNSYVSGTVDIQQINGAGVSPTFGFAIGADFK